ncbi:SAM-dependent methyltransferase [Amycolatopsis sp. OK19-0408]|uniref:SAM-dependent methyltransferase n=1 Tax=Amycolatopsis iheyensis TaxID=2945988 RepID=A0A9X2NK91_9PSEU|nr:SAM-dependent methyltransferase [Amycolatopsis iheyensis]MCR6488330.1 SAM-dependent methyltransferase [Amycolatopsis iheyensis]
MPRLTTATPAHQRAQDGERVHPDIESPRRDAVVDYLLDGSLNTAIDRIFADRLIAEHPQLPRLAIAAAAWDRAAAQAMLEHGLRHFLVLGTGGLPIWAHSSTLADLHDAGARIIVIEHDPVTRNLHDHIDRGAAAGRAQVLSLPADRHHDLAATSSVTDLLTAGAPIGILVTGPLRPAGIRLATILALLDKAPPHSVAAITQLTDHGAGVPDGTDVSLLARRFAEAGIPLAVEDRLVADQLLSNIAHLPAHSVAPAVMDRDAVARVLRVGLVSRRHSPTSTAAPRPSTQRVLDVDELGDCR